MDNSLQPISDEADLEKQSKRDNFYITRVFKYVLLICACAVLIVLTVGFIFKFVTDTSFQASIMSIIQTYFSAIVLAGLSILGINIYSKNSK